MKISSLLFAALLMGQILPVMAMERPKIGFSDVQALFRKGVDFIFARPSAPYVFAGIAGFALLMDRFGGDIQWKIGCYRGTISPDDQLMRAVCHNDLKEAQQALNRGANPNAYICADAYSCIFPSSLRSAIHRDNEEMVDVLLKNGADVLSGDALGYTLVANNLNHRFNKSIARKLFEAGANTQKRISVNNVPQTVKQFAQAEAARTGNQDYANIFKRDIKL